MLEKIKDFYEWQIRDTIISVYFKTIYGFRNLYIWFHIIWNDRDWDYQYLNELIRFKLKRMEHSHRKYSQHTNNEVYADQIKKCYILLDRIVDDNDYENEYKMLKEFTKLLSDEDKGLFHWWY